MRVFQDAQNICAITVVGTALKLPIKSVVQVYGDHHEIQTIIDFLTD